ncbi:MAG: DUF418 domain-containing protein, partial [Gammaproteobacteria bacterium]
VGELDDATAARVAAWERKEQRARPDLADPKIQESIRINSRGQLGEFLVERWTTSLIVQIFVGLKAWSLDALGTMLLGMALFKTGVLTLTASRATCVRMVVVGYGIGLPLAIWETSTLVTANFDPLLKARHLLHYDVRRIAVALGHLGVILLLCRAYPTGRLLTKIGAVGRMALTNYLGQSILGGLIFYSIGLGLYGQFTGFHLYLVVVFIWTVQIAFSNWWLARFRFGPCEWLWRSMTYGRRQPWK